MAHPKVLFMLHDLAGGGAERVFINIANGFAAKGIKVEMLLGKKTGHYLNLLNKDIDIHELHAVNLLQILRKLPKVLRKKNYTHLFTASDKYSVASVIIKKIFRLNTKVICTLHYNLPFQISVLPILNQLYLTVTNRYIISKADKIISVSNGVGTGFEKIAGKKLSRLTTIYNPVFDETIYESATENIDDPIFQNGKTTLINIGKLRDNPKNQKCLIAALAILNAENKNIQVVFLGQGDDEFMLNKMAEEMGIKDCVHFLGFKSNPFKYIAASSLLVVSSTSEGFGNVIVEALALGVNVVSTDCPSGPSEILEKGKFGWLCEVNNHIDMADKISSALSNFKPKEILIERANDFQTKKIVEEYINIL